MKIFPPEMELKMNDDNHMPTNILIYHLKKVSAWLRPEKGPLVDQDYEEVRDPDEDNFENRTGIYH